jgi:lactoylglutathione lyase
MKLINRLIALAAVAFVPLAFAQESKTMELGNFSVSLAVKDIKVSLAFYEKLGFKPVGGKLEQNWIVLQNGSTKIGLFEGMFPKNLMTFNPGWSQDRMALERFQDVRELQRSLKARGLTMAVEADETTQGPAHFVVTDPDGNELLFDQHVPRPKK